MKTFNTTGICIPSKHYMVDISAHTEEIKKLVDAGRYFTINRARQYGKTTTLSALRGVLTNEYEVLGLSFEGIGDAGFKTEQSFVKAFCRRIRREYRNGINPPISIREQLDEFISRKKEKAELDELFDVLLAWCDESNKGIVLIIDEVDSATNNQVFLDFLGQLRDGFINRDAKGTATFQSVILASVTDIKCLRSRIRADADAKENSPWSIASDFTIDMSLPENGIHSMLEQYEADHKTGMNAATLARLLWEYTNGYPFLVSRICQLMDERIAMEVGLSSAWTTVSLKEAVKLILSENNTLFQSLTKTLNNSPSIKAAIRSILIPNSNQIKHYTRYTGA